MPEHELKQRLTSEEVTKLIAADNLGLIPEPWMESATICAVIANVNRAEGVKPFTPDDFIPSRVRRKENPRDEMLKLAESRKRQWQT